MFRAMRLLGKTVVVALALASVTCGPPPGGGTGPKGKGSSVNPDSCGKFDTNDAGRKLYAFLKATAELDRQVSTLHADARRTCVAMAAALELPAAQRNGDLKVVCGNVAREIRDGLDQSFEGEYKMTVEYQPAVCTVDVDVAARAAAECTGTASADIKVACEGSCSGSCNGVCDGTCTTRNASGECAGECQGTCRGSCSGTCQGSADVQADVSCEATAEIRANINAECTDPVFETKWEEPRVKDPARLKRIDAALAIGIPALGKIGAKLTGPVAKAVATWGKATYNLVEAGGKLLEGLGDAAVCVGIQLALALEAVARIQAQVTVTVEVSVEVSGSAGVK